MRVFVTGATGYLGAAIAARLVRARHDVCGLARSASRAEALVALGVRPVSGDLAVRETFFGELRNSDAVIHAAIDPADPARRDQEALEEIRDAVLDGRVRRVLYTSGIWAHGDTGERVADESAPLSPAEISQWRPAHEQEVLELSEHGAQVIVLRPGVVYGGRGGIIGEWLESAREHGVLSYPGGDQHWPVVHRDDVAEAYRLAVEHGEGGHAYLLTDESRFTVRQLAESLARSAGVPARAIPEDELLRTEGAVGAALLRDQQFTSMRARRELGWVPRHLSFVDEAPALYREWVSGGRAAVA